MNDFDPISDDDAQADPASLDSDTMSAPLQALYAWGLLRCSGMIQPPLARSLLPHRPRFRIWHDPRGFTDMEPTTLTVFRGSEPPCVVREAVWHRMASWRTTKSLADVAKAVSVRDAEVPFEHVREHLKAIAACTIPAITMRSMRSATATTDVGSIGFEHFSTDDPPARVEFQWSDVTPPAWGTLIKHVVELNAFLNGCFK
jgi:hypothetical protein